LPSIQTSEASQPTSGFRQCEHVRVRRGHVEPSGEAGEAGAVFLHPGDGGSGDQLGALATEQVGIRDHEVFDAKLGGGFR
jgi:hypothetical protein